MSRSGVTEGLGMFFDGIGKLINTLLILCVVFVPLGLWKFVEIVIWVYKHIHIHINFK
jgi:hypothetical protein